MNRIILLINILVISFIGCKPIENNGEIISKTMHELTNEFLNDWENSHEYYKEKKIEVSGYLIFAGNKYLELGEHPIAGNWENEHTINTVIITCEFDTMVILFYDKCGLKQDQNIVIRGDYVESLYSSEVKSLLLANCELISNNFFEYEKIK